MENAMEKKLKPCICRPRAGIYCESTNDISACFKCGWNSVVEKERKEKLYAKEGLTMPEPIGS